MHLQVLAKLRIMLPTQAYRDLFMPIPCAFDINWRIAILHARISIVASKVLEHITQRRACRNCYQCTVRPATVPPSQQHSPSHLETGRTIQKIGNLLCDLLSSFNQRLFLAHFSSLSIDSFPLSSLPRRSLLSLELYRASQQDTEINLNRDADDEILKLFDVCEIHVLEDHECGFSSCCGETDPCEEECSHAPGLAGVEAVRGFDAGIGGTREDVDEGADRVVDVLEEGEGYGCGEEDGVYLV